MNTIKIYLKESGSVAELKKDFNLYMEGYQNTLINVFVPKPILLDSVLSEDTMTSNVVKIGGIGVSPSGESVTTKAYNMSYVKECELNGVVFELYQCMLPKEFCLYAGNETLVVNVANLIEDSTGAKVERVVTSQTCVLNILESSSVEYEPIEPSETDKVYGAINNLYKVFNTLAIKKFDVNNLQGYDVDFQVDGKKTLNTMYYNYPHGVRVWDRATRAYKTEEKVGALFVFGSETVQYEYFFVGKKIFVRSLELEEVDGLYSVKTEDTNFYELEDVGYWDNATLEEAKNYTYSKETIDGKDSDLKNELEAQINIVKSIAVGRLNAISFKTEGELVSWLSGDFVREDGKTPGDLVFGQNIYTEKQEDPDYWVKELPVESLDDLAVLPTDKVDMSEYLHAYKIAYDNKSERLNATNLQDAVDELAYETDNKTQIVELGQQTLSQFEWHKNEEQGYYEYYFKNALLTNVDTQAVELTPDVNTSINILGANIVVYPTIETRVIDGVVCAVVTCSNEPEFDMVVDAKLKTTTFVEPNGEFYAEDIKFANQGTGLVSKTVQEALAELSAKKVDKVVGKELSTNDFTDEYKSALEADTQARHTHSNKGVLDAVEQALTTSLKTSYDDAVTKAHTHSNKDILDATTASFTTALESEIEDATAGVADNAGAIDDIVDGTTTVGKATSDGAGNNISTTYARKGGAHILYSTDSPVTRTVGEADALSITHPEGYSYNNLVAVNAKLRIDSNSFEFYALKAPDSSTMYASATMKYTWPVGDFYLNFRFIHFAVTENKFYVDSISRKAADTDKAEDITNYAIEKLTCYYI